jgi:type II secretory pathway component GspD/PulD (secretin)
MKLLWSFLLLSLSLKAEVLQKNHKGEFVFTKDSFETREILSDYARLEELNLVMEPAQWKEVFHRAGPKTMAPSVMQNYLSVVLMQAGASAVVSSDKTTLHVLPARDMRYTPLPHFTDSKDIPANHNYAQLTRELKHIKASELTRNLRPFLGRYGRVIDDVPSNTITITDMGINIKRAMQIADHLDTETFARREAFVEAENEKYQQIIRPERGLAEILASQQGIFLLVFLLLGGIIGFGVRGYMMKRVEGGW